MSLMINDCLMSCRPNVDAVKHFLSLKCKVSVKQWTAV